MNGVNVQSSGHRMTVMSRVVDGRIDDIIEEDDFHPAKYASTDDAVNWPALFLQMPPREGAIGTVYRTASGVVIKFAHREKDARESLLYETQIYIFLKEHHISSIPIYYGLFASRDDFALVLSDEGHSLEDFSGLSKHHKYVPQMHYCLRFLRILTGRISLIH